MQLLERIQHICMYLIRKECRVKKQSTKRRIECTFCVRKEEITNLYNGTSLYVQRETLHVLVGEQDGLHWAAQNYVESVIQLP